MIKGLYQKIFSEKIRFEFNIKLRKIKGFFLVGNKFYCPCCQHSYSKFLKKGNGLISRENAVCPNCGSLERTRLLFMYLKEETRIFHNSPYILHFAPEDILKSKFIQNPNYYDADLNPNLARFQMDITQINFPDCYFDYIICSHVLGHVPDEKKALEEMYRVLKPGGQLFLLSLINIDSEQTFEDESATSENEKLHAYGEKDLERLYGNDFEDRIENDAVTVERVDYRNHFDAATRLRFSLGDGRRELIYVVTKK